MDIRNSRSASASLKVQNPFCFLCDTVDLSPLLAVLCKLLWSKCHDPGPDEGEPALRPEVLYPSEHRAHRALQHLTDYIGRVCFRLYIGLPVGNSIYQFGLYYTLSGLVYKTFSALPIQDPTHLGPTHVVERFITLKFFRKLETLLDQIPPSRHCTHNTKSDISVFVVVMGCSSGIEGLFIIEGDTFYENKAKHQSVKRQSFTSAFNNMCADVCVCLAPSL